MIAGLKPYPDVKDSGVQWLGKVPKHWEVRRLRNVADMRVSNVDKHVKADENLVRLCNYVDVYKNDYINKQMDFMQATATNDESSSVSDLREMTSSSPRTLRRGMTLGCPHW